MIIISITTVMPARGGRRRGKVRPPRHPCHIGRSTGAGLAIGITPIRAMLGRAGSWIGTSSPRSRPWRACATNAPSAKRTSPAAASVRSRRRPRRSARRCCGGRTTGAAIARGIISRRATPGRTTSDIGGESRRSSRRWRTCATNAPSARTRRAYRACRRRCHRGIRPGRRPHTRRPVPRLPRHLNDRARARPRRHLADRARVRPSRKHRRRPVQLPQLETNCCTDGPI